MSTVALYAMLGTAALGLVLCVAGLALVHLHFTRRE
jgi:hypothetical protein